MKCQLCKKKEWEWYMQFVASDDPTFAFPGWHYRGFVCVKVCDDCRKLIEEKGIKEDQIAAQLNEPKQTSMFDDGSDLPLFSGTPPKKV